MKTFSRLEASGYIMSQYESLNIDIIQWGLDSYYFEYSNQTASAVVDISVKKIVNGISNIVGVSSSNIVSIKAIESTANFTGISKLNSTSRAIFKGSTPLILGVSHINESSQFVEAIITISYANGTFNLVDFVSGDVNLKQYISGALNIEEVIQGDLSTLESINGTLNVVEIFSGNYSAPQNGG